MKKLIAISLFTAGLAATSAFGQGYFTFTGLTRTVWDGFSTPGNGSILAATVDTAFLWAPANTTPDVATVTGVASTPTNNSSPLYNGFSTPQAWSAILDGQFTLATNNNTGALASVLCGATGFISYLGGTPFPVAGTTGGVTYTVYIIGWDAQYATPALAAAAFGGVGWSSPFQYTSAVGVIGTPPPMPRSDFGVIGPVPVPEPATLALAALGGLSLVAFRPRKTSF